MPDEQWDVQRSGAPLNTVTTIEAARADAWDEGWDAAYTMARSYGHTDYWEDEPDNPYRITNDEVAR